MDPKAALKIAIQAASAAGKFLLDNSKSIIEVDKEEGRDIKLKADRNSERIILDFLKKGSDFPILSEEKGAIGTDGAEFKWIVDPLDGSLNYMRGIPLACVSIGLWKDTEPILGVVYDFNRSELFSGIVGSGAWLNDRKICDSTIDKKEKAVLCTGFPVSTDFSTGSLTDYIGRIQEYKKIRLFGSAALSLAYVACGRADVYLENGIRIWDVAAGLALVKSAGGSVRYSLQAGNNTLKVQASNRHFKC